MLRTSIVPVAAAAFATLVAGQEPPLLPSALNISLSQGPLIVGQSLSVSVLLSVDGTKEDASLRSPFFAYQIAVLNTNEAGETISDVTGMRGWTNSPSFASLGNASTAPDPFDDQGDFRLVQGDKPICTPAGSKSGAAYTFNTSDWSAGSYIVDVRLHTLGSNSPLIQSPDNGEVCMFPPFANYSSQAITYFKLENGTRPTSTPTLVTTAVPMPTSVDAYGNPQTLPDRIQSATPGNADRVVASFALLSLIGMATATLLA